MTRESVGVVGQGTMGSHYRDNLLDAGYDVTVYDVDETAVEEAVEAGAGAAQDPAALAGQVDVVIVSVWGSPVVEAVMEGERGVLEELSAGQVVIDTSTTRVDVDVQYARACEAGGAGFLDAPVTWTGPAEGVDMFVGGDPGTYEEAREVLDVIAGVHDHYGDVGAGQVVKAAQRMDQTFWGIVHAEVTEFCRNNGIDPEQVDAQLDLGLSAGFDPEVAFGADAGRRLREDADLDAGVELDDRGVRPHLHTGAHKDLQYALDIAHSSNTAVPILSVVYEILKANVRYGQAARVADEDAGRPDREAYWGRLNRPEADWLAAMGEDE